MCGRFTLSIPFEQIIDYFEIVNGADVTYEPSYNIAPSQNILAVVSNGEIYKGGFLKWGLVPSWAKDPTIGYKMINARSETLDQKPSFKKLLSRRRCIIVADGFYEWKKDNNGEKQPFRITHKSSEPLAFAGLWDRCVIDNTVLTTCTIITTNANAMMKDIHERMPVILPKNSIKIWLDRRNEKATELKKLLVPYDKDDMMVYEVSSLVNSPKNNEKTCIEAVNSL